MSSQTRIVIFESSGKLAHVALAEGERLLISRSLSEPRRHARELVPVLDEIMSGQTWKPTDIDAVFVDIGPGSYTGLRVGVMTAKTLAYATGCTLLAIDAMTVLAQQAPDEADSLDIFIDAQQDRVYWQRFRRQDSVWLAMQDLAIIEFAQWLSLADKPGHVSGPGLHGKENRLPNGVTMVPEALWTPQPEYLLQVGLPRLLRGECDTIWAVEPLYLRPSAAEEQWQERRSSSKDV